MNRLLQVTVVVNDNALRFSCVFKSHHYFLLFIVLLILNVHCLLVLHLNVEQHVLLSYVLRVQLHDSFKNVAHSI